MVILNSGLTTPYDSENNVHWPPETLMDNVLYYIGGEDVSVNWPEFYQNTDSNCGEITYDVNSRPLYDSFTNVIQSDWLTWDSTDRNITISTGSGSFESTMLVTVTGYITNDWNEANMP
jgi:hypothetical protein